MRSKNVTKEERLKVIDNNPCGICRANGLPLCKGHGKFGGGNSGGSSTSGQEDTPASSFGPSKEVAHLQALFQDSPLWSQDMDGDDFIFKWSNPDSILSIEADIGTGSITILSNPEALAAQQKTQEEFIYAIMNEFHLFKKKLAAAGVPIDGMRVIQVGNQLKIAIPNKIYYDAFMLSLIERNLLATELISYDNAAEMTPLTEVQKRAKIPGIATATISVDGIITTQTAGVTNSTTSEAVTEATVFEAASLSKPVFAYIVLKLAQQGTIDLDRPLYQYCDFGPPEMRAHENYRKLTARMILSHQAGLPNEFHPPLIPLEYVSPAGERFDYSAEAYRFLNEVVEHITEKSLELLAQEAFSAIGMTHSSFMPPTGCSLIRLQDEEELSPAGIKKILEHASDKHGQLSIIYHRDQLYVAERAVDGTISIIKKDPASFEESIFQSMQERITSIPPFFWSKFVPIEARELPLVRAIVGHLPKSTSSFAIGHHADGSVNFAQRFYGVQPAGSLYTSVTDYAQFIKACATDPYIRTEMVKPALITLKDRDPKAIAKGVSPEVLEKLSWGLGIGLQVGADGSPIAFHWGDGSGKNLAAVNLISGEAVVCLTNSENGAEAFRAVAEPVVGDLSFVSQWLSQREGLSIGSAPATPSEASSNDFSLGMK